MSQAIVTGDNHGTDAAVLPKMNIRTANTGCSDMDKAVIGPDLGDFAFYQTKVVIGVSLYGVVDGLSLEYVHGGSCLEGFCDFDINLPKPI